MNKSNTQKHPKANIIHKPIKSCFFCQNKSIPGGQYQGISVAGISAGAGHQKNLLKLTASMYL